MNRSSGILLPVSALPGPCGIGDLGADARDFIDFLAAAGQRYWQILPLNPPDGAHSPYLSASTFAGSTDLLSPEPFVARGALTADEVRAIDWGEDPMRVADILRAAFDVRVLCWNPRRTAAECAAWGYEQVATLPELFHRSDFVNVSITLCDATRDLINAPVFAAVQHRRPVLVLESAHPSPLSAYRGFFGSAPFGKINAFLQQHGEAAIDWLK